VALIGAWLWSLGPSTLSAGEPYQLVNALVFIGLLVGGALLSLWVNGERRRMTQAAVLALMAVDLMTTHRGRFYLLTSPNEAGELALAAAAPPGYDTFYRLAADQLSGQDFGSVLGVDNVGGKPPLDLKHYRLLLSSVDAYRRNVLLNVEVVATNGLFTDPSYTLIAEAHGYSYYRFSPTLPRAYLVRQIIEVSGPTEAAEKIAAPDFDPWRTALVEGHVVLDPGPPLSPTEGAQVIGRTANTLTLAVIAASQRFLVVSEVNYPGWIAEVDGEVTPIVPTNVALRGILLASGTHTVVMRFRPPLFFAGITVSSLTVLCLLIWFSLPLFRRQSAR
jgi:hypothetical protein